MDTQNKPQEISPKMNKFFDELNALCEKYEYNLKPILDVKLTGIIPSLTVIDAKPKENIIKEATK